MDLKQFWEQDLQFKFAAVLEDTDLGLTPDHSDYVYVDGEEGDYGVIRYLDQSGQVVATKTLEGGDVQILAITEHGKTMIAAKLCDLFKITLDDVLKLPPAA